MPYLGAAMAEGAQARWGEVTELFDTSDYRPGGFGGAFEVAAADQPIVVENLFEVLRGRVGR
jgi:hypothetical protein